MELAAVVVVPDNEAIAAIHQPPSRLLPGFENLQPSYSSRTPILGNDLLHSWMARIRKLGVKHLWLTSAAHDSAVPGSAVHDQTSDRLRSALAGFAGHGIERLLTIKLRSYAEMDLPDLLRFHCESRNSVTEAHDAQGLLGVSLLDRLALHDLAENGDSQHAAKEGMPYSFRGYAKRVLSAKERQELVGDGLIGACAMRPHGTQIRDQVWIGEATQLADSVRIIGPAYIGTGSIIRSGATIGPFASVERDCIVDCGTTVERSTILPHTYLAPGILIRDSLVDGGHLEDLRRSAIADLHSSGLAKRIERREKRSSTSACAQFSSSACQWQATACAPPSELWRQVEL